MRRFIVSCGVLFGLVASSAPVGAEPPPSSPIANEDPELATRRAEALALHEEGVALYEQREVRRALERFDAAFALFPAVKHAENAAFCHEKLDEPVEALVRYEDLLQGFEHELLPEHRARIEARIAALRGRVAELSLEANVTGTVVIDGRTRGELPLTRRLYVEPGSHRLRVAREGYATFELTIDVEGGKRLSIGARLAPLLDQGRVRVEDPSGAAVRVLVNGAQVGEAPWEGPLAPGKYAIWTVGEGVGTAPEPVIVLRGQTALVRLPSRPLGARVRIDVDPPSAELTLGDASLGPGAWEGRLPPGRYRLSAHASGFRSVRDELVVPASEASLERTIRLPIVGEVPPPAPWLPGSPWLGVTLGLALTDDLGAAPERLCPAQCTGDGGVFGGAALARVGWRFPSGLSVQLGAGYLSLSTDVATFEDASFTVALAPRVVRYSITHALSLQGPIFSFGGGYALPLTPWLDARGALDLGLFLARGHDRIDATVGGDGRTVDAWVSGADAGLELGMPWVAPELELAVHRGPFELGLALAAWAFPASDAAFGDVEVGPRATDDAGLPTCTAATPVPGCAPGEPVARGAAHGAFVAWVPSLSARYVFGGP